MEFVFSKKKNDPNRAICHVGHVTLHFGLHFPCLYMFLFKSVGVKSVCMHVLCKFMHA